MAIRIFPLMLDAAVGGIDGILQEADNTATVPRTANLKQYSTWFEAAAFGGGLLMSLMRFSDTITDPLTMGGLALLSRRGGLMLAASQKPHAFALPMPTYTAARAPFVQDVPGDPAYRIEPSGVMG